MNHRLRNTQLGVMPDDAVEKDAASSAEPSWFLDPANDGMRHALSERYRQSRDLHQGSGNVTRKTRPAPEHRAEWLESRARPPAHFLRDMHKIDGKASPRRRDRPNDTTRLAGTFAIAAFAAALCGGAAGIINTNLEPLKASALALISGQTIPDGIARQVSSTSRDVTQTVITRKEIATATLDVTDVTGEANSLIPLALHAEPALQGQDLLLKISGLPDTAYLTAGQKSEEVWTLAMDDLKNLKLMIPEDRKGHLDVAVAAYERKTGELAAPVKSMSVAISGAVVTPAAAPPPGAVQASTRTQPARVQLTAIPQPVSMGAGLNSNQEAALSKSLQGDGHLLRGDITGARRLYGEAWSLGSAEGAYGLGRSYDPVALAVSRLGKADADSARALVWYERAALAGKTEAISAIVRLRLKPN